MSRRVQIRAEGLLFDNDGVIVSSIASVDRCWRRWAAHYGVPDADKVQIAHGTRAVEIMQMLKPGVDEAEGLRLIEDMEIADVADLEVLPGVRRLLKSLPPERWAIVSSATWRLLVGRLHAAGLPVPAHIVSGDRVERGKPDPEPYRKGAELVHAAPADCLVLEDAPTGVQAGKAAGCRVLGILGTHNAQELQAAGADWVTESLESMSVRSDAEGLALDFEVL